LRTRAQKQQRQHSGRSIELRDKPTLLELVEELEQLIDQFQAILGRCPVEPAVEENLPVRLPLNLRWRPRAGEGEPSGTAAEVIAWTDRLRIHLVNLERYFSDWQDRPEALDGFPPGRLPPQFPRIPRRTPRRPPRKAQRARAAPACRGAETASATAADTSRPFEAGTGGAWLESK